MASSRTTTVHALATFLLLIMSVVLMAAPYAEAAVTCGSVAGAVAPCIRYLQGPGGAVPPACCSGIRKLRAASTTPADLKTACTCLKSLATGIKNLNYGLAAGLPGACSVDVPFKISPSTDCNKIQ